MSLRIRLVLLIVVLVALVTVALSAWYLANLVNSVSSDALDRSELASQQVKAFVIDQINQHAEDYETPANLEETRALWNEIVSGDRDISMMLEKMLALSAALVEINIAGQTGDILASSNPSRIGKPLAPLELFGTWKSRPLYRRMLDLMKRQPDYAGGGTLGLRRPVGTGFHGTGGGVDGAIAERNPVTPGDDAFGGLDRRAPGFAASDRPRHKSRPTSFETH